MAICPMCGSQNDERLQIIDCEMCEESGVEGCCIIDGICEDCSYTLLNDDLVVDQEEYEFEDDADPSI